MTNRLLLAVAFLAVTLAPSVGYSQAGAFHVLAFYSTDVEADHVDFARQAVTFFANRAARDHYLFASTANWDEMNPERLKDVQIILWLNDSADRKSVV